MRRIAVVTLALLIGGLTHAGPARAQTVSCGQIITVSTTLSNDVGPCSVGVTVGADGITLDLAGHRIFGTVARGDGAGISLNGRNGVTVKGPGSVTNFDGGVVIVGGSGNLVTGLTVKDNIGGDALGDGILLHRTRGNRVAGNQISNNGPLSGISLISDGATAIARDNVIDSNSISGNVIGRDGTTSNTDNDGVRVENFSAFNTISNNEISGNGLDGISLFADTADNTVRSNRVTNSGYYRTTARRGSGIIVFSRSTRNKIENNTTTGNADSGIDIRGPVGTSAGATNNIIRFNLSVGNSTRPPLASSFGPSFDLKDLNLNCDNNLWSGNRYRTFNQACVTAGGQKI